MIQSTLHTIRRLASTPSKKYKAKAAVPLNRITSLLIHWSLGALHEKTHTPKQKERFHKLSWQQTTSSRKTHRKPDTTLPPLFQHLYPELMISWTHVMLSHLWTCQALTPTLIFAILLASWTELACVLTGAPYSRDWRSRR
jgi:hypothetical protein